MVPVGLLNMPKMEMLHIDLNEGTLGNKSKIGKQHSAFITAAFAW